MKKDWNAAGAAAPPLSPSSVRYGLLWGHDMWRARTPPWTVFLVQHSVVCAEYLRRLKEHHTKDPRAGFLFEPLEGRGPPAAAASAEPVARKHKKRKVAPAKRPFSSPANAGITIDNESPKLDEENVAAPPTGEPPVRRRTTRQPKVASAKGPFSPLANAGFVVDFKKPRSYDVLAGGRVFVSYEVFSPELAYEYASETVWLEFARLGNQDKGLRLLSERQVLKDVTNDLNFILRQKFGGIGWPYADCFEIFFYTFLCTLPGCPAQDKHIDHTDTRVWSLIVCVGYCMREVRFIVDGEEVVVILSPGDAVLFHGSVCHFGGPAGTNCRCLAADPCRAESGKELSVNLRCVELALHCYVVVEHAGSDLPRFDWRKLGKDVFSCPARV